MALRGLRNIVDGNSQTQSSLSTTPDKKLSPKQKGLRQGAALMLLSVILVPAYVLLAALFPANDRLVESAVSDTPFEKISQAILITIFLIGLARAAYAWFFQEGERQILPNSQQPGDGNREFGGRELPPARATPVDGFGAWRANTGELVEPKASK